MSARAAWRLETLGFEHVSRYTAGKSDWTAAGLPGEGKLASVPRIGDVARRDVPTSYLDERVREVRDRVRATDWNRCVVINERRVVLGLVQGEALEAPAETAVAEVMDPAPVTFRPDMLLQDMVAYMREKEVETVLVTTSDGELVGSLSRADAEHALHETHQSGSMPEPSP